MPAVCEWANLAEPRTNYVFFSTPLSLSVYVRSILGMISLTILSMCLFCETKLPVNGALFVCPSVCMSVLYRLQNVIVWSYCDH